MEREEAEAIYDQGRETVVAVLLRMDEQIQRLEKRVGQQDERIAQLERRLGRSSRNSSQPPSQDPPGSAPKRGKDPSGRAQGGQAGHEGHGRRLLPMSAVDEVVEHWPDRCGCGHVFCADEHTAVGEPARHQVEELPVMAVHVIEHQCQRVRCPDCGQRQTGVLPGEVAHSAFGPRLAAAVATLSVRNRISRRDVVELCEQLFAARISTGSVEAILQRASDALAEPYADLLEEIRLAPAVNMDETGWRLRGAQRALWGAFTDRHAVLAIARDRHEDHAKALLGPSQAIVTSDRWWAYGHLPLKRRQVCWSHLQRDFAAHAEGLGAEKELGEAGLRICDELFWSWEIYQHTDDRAELKRRIRVLRREFKPIVRRYAGKARATALAAASRATSSRSGPPCGPSPPTPACSPPTTTPNARCAARSSPASCRWAASQPAASDAPSACCRPTPPAASNAARCTPTSSNCSARKPAATPPQC